ncbi:hypothetical protein FB451DRAFT_1194706 [Mycena latifolia]|nr:hypothetical protein FB451DRAFT_1194706 [Mycena latifolia]
MVSCVIQSTSILFEASVRRIRGRAILRTSINAEGTLPRTDAALRGIAAAVRGIDEALRGSAAALRGTAAAVRGTDAALAEALTRQCGDVTRRCGRKILGTFPSLDLSFQYAVEGDEYCAALHPRRGNCTATAASVPRSAASIPRSAAAVAAFSPGPPYPVVVPQSQSRSPSPFVPTDLQEVPAETPIAKPGPLTVTIPNPL